MRLPYERLDSVQQILSYQLDLDLQRIDRTVYNGLNWLGDLGGLQQALAVVISALITLTNYQSLENYLVHMLFRQKNTS